MKILRTIWFALVGLVFTIILMLFIPFWVIGFALFGKKFTRTAAWTNYNILGRIGLGLAFVFLKVRGKKHFDKKRSYVLVSNHQSLLDIFANAVSCPVVSKFLAKAELGRAPIFGYTARSLCILIDRKSVTSRHQSYMNMKNALDEGFSIFIYPEGTRNRSDKPLRKFYDGAFRLAIETQTPIMVQTLVGTKRLCNPNRLLDLSPGLVHCYWDPPIETTGMTLDDIPRLKEQVQQTMLKYLT